MLAALASAAMPSIVMAGVRDSERANDTDDAAGIDQAVMQDAAGRMYDIYACDTEDGRKRLTGRVQAARTLERAKDPGGLGFALDTVLAFVDGKEKSTLTGGATVMVAAHNDGVARPLDLLTLDDCAAMGTAIAARRKAHLGLSIVTDRVSPKARIIIQMTVYAISALFCLLIVVTGVQMVISQYQLGQETANMQWPEWIYGSFVPVGAAFAAIAFLQTMVQMYKDYRAEEGK